MRLPFVKYSGCGNDFILIDNRQQDFPFEDRTFIQQLCQRRTGVGADGIVLLENSPSADFRMRIFNSDGGEAEMCGNGIRCLLKFIRELGFAKSQFKIDTMLRVLTLELKGENVCVEMGDPFDLRWDLMLEIDGHAFSFQYLNTGVPHAVIFVDDCRQVDIEKVGPKIRHHALFAPQGTNVNFASLKNDELWNRTFERGVEEETLACGTGATAAALAAAKIMGLESPVRVHTLSKDVLEIGFTAAGDTFRNVTMSGPAVKVFQGEFWVEDNCAIQ